MTEQEMKKYTSLNELAETAGTVVFGGASDKEIPLCELKQAFCLKEALYNRSFDQLSVKNAVKAYNSCIAELAPACILLHLGAADIALFEEDSFAFDKHYRSVVQHIKSATPNCTIGIITLKNPDNSSIITELNKHLKYIADSERCEFEDISVKRVWNPKETKEVASFVYSTGFVRPLKNHRSIYDLVKLLFCL